MNLSLHFLKRTCDGSERESVSVVDGSGSLWFETFTVDTCRVGAIKVGKRVTAPDMLDDGVHTRRCVCSLIRTKVNGWPVAAQVMVIATYQRTLTFQLYRCAIAEGKNTPDSIRVDSWLQRGVRLHWLR